MPTGGPKQPAKKGSSKTSNSRKKSVTGGVPAGRQVPWALIGAAAAVIVLVAVIAVSVFPKYQQKAAVDAFTPSASNPDPSTSIPGVVKMDYPAGQHVTADQRVAYDKIPPFGGPHDQAWANCMGTVYPKGLRTENAVHSLEHGAVWITYNPDKLTPQQIAELATKVDGHPYMLMSPYPGMDSALSLQSWGHQLKLDSPTDPRVDEFITALRLNDHTYPEVGASCSTDPSFFDPNNPPPFDPAPPGPDAIQMNGKGAEGNPTDQPMTGGNG
ncbi:DUF3105 domain-containing protein [Rhodococcus sp. D2-41]|uniref:DUF3105 domain-containing protein n=1 Tax=Speluncibacter jeojiensis TaxID=2710754 RepID=A0A9X4RFI1_9ACTN|nr:DUF3105 domain-containing protein [Rhodococcus sp. D2-41]MDG3012825.1 DUF3105 domain-containing protein [Rhodococcus sp. D2-41]MDG3017060.1 DUF3105 domain-containing protein [Corynebacteriales bacterium D3-21]